MKRVLIGVGIVILAIGALMCYDFWPSNFEPTASAKEIVRKWPSEGSLEKPQPPSVEDQYGQAPPVLPAAIKPGDSPGQKDVATFVEDMGVMRPVQVKSGDKASASRSEFVDGDDVLKVVTTRNFETV